MGVTIGRGNVKPTGAHPSMCIGLDAANMLINAPMQEGQVGDPSKLRLLILVALAGRTYVLGSSAFQARVKEMLLLGKFLVRMYTTRCITMKPGLMLTLWYLKRAKALC